MGSLAALPWIALTAVVILAPLLLYALKGSKSRWVGIAVLFYSVMAFAASTYIGRWSFWSYYLLLVFLIVGLVAAIVAFKQIRFGNWSRPGKFGLLATATMLLGGLYFTQSNVRAITAVQMPDGAIDMQFPLARGTYAMVQAGSGRPLQLGHASVPSQQYAVDVVALNAGLHGRNRYLDASDFRAVEIWEAAVLAPCTGTVEWVRDSLPDNLEPDEEHPAGNAVALNCDGITVYLAHLRQNSVLVAEGDNVRAGETIAAVGNSGRSPGAHLHIHAERGPLKLDFSDNEGVPITFEGAFPFRNRIMTSTQPAE